MDDNKIINVTELFKNKRSNSNNETYKNSELLDFNVEKKKLLIENNLNGIDILNTILNKIEKLIDSEELDTYDYYVITSMGHVANLVARVIEWFDNRNELGYVDLEYDRSLLTHITLVTMIMNEGFKFIFTNTHTVIRNDIVELSNSLVSFCVDVLNIMNEELINEIEKYNA